MLKTLRITRFNSLCRAFTLLELLAVIAVIVILVALLLTTLSSAKAFTKRVTCLNQERQLGMLQTASSEDQNGSLFARGPQLDWVDSIQDDASLSPKMLICPTVSINSSSKQNLLIIRGKKTILPRLDPERSYVLNGCSDYLFETDETFDWLGKNVNIPAVAALYPSQTILMGEKHLSSDFKWVDVLPLGGDYSDHIAESRHRRTGVANGVSASGANYLFIDGHAESISFGKATCPENLWATTDKWRTHAALCRPR